MIKQGKITSWNDDKGYGFITPSSGEGQVFVHIKAFKYQARRPEVNRLVNYLLSTDNQGRICAAEVIMPAAAVVEKNDQDNRKLSNIFAGLFLGIVAICCIFGIAPLWAFVLYLVISLMTYIFYYFDKSAAQKGEWRTPENTLHLLALFGGWPGALIAQQILRHKSQKKAFRAFFWVTVVLNICAFIILTTPNAAKTLESLHKAKEDIQSIPITQIATPEPIATQDSVVVEKTVAAPRPLVASEPVAQKFSCDGRTHCSQMTSCDEAMFFIKNCPNTQMDGNGDGVPCEKQWCK